MYCDRCGTQLNAGAQFCVKCGKAIVGGVEAVPEGQVRASIRKYWSLWGSGRWAGAAEFADAGDALDD